MNKETLILPENWNPSISIGSFATSIILSFILSSFLSKIYKRESNCFSNPEILADIFPLLSIGTTIIIAVVKSSLALSLGLVGALSIVRFRTPIKEPEELTYIFLCIGIGLATGSNQYVVAIVGFSLTVLCIFLNKKLNYKNNFQNNIAISISKLNNTDVSKVIELISKNSTYVNFNNLTTSKSNIDNQTTITLSFTPKDFNNINAISNEILSTFPYCSLNIFDKNTF